MKILKKISYIFLIIVLLSSQVIVPDLYLEAEAKSLNDMIAELAELEKKYAEYEKEQDATEEEILEAETVIAEMLREKEDIEKEIEKLNAEIIQLEKDIIAKNEEMKNIVKYYQLSSTGEDAYLEYLFTATDFTDFIYRMAIAEQLSDYNDKLIDEYNALLTANEEKKEKLSAKAVQLDKKTKEVENKLVELNGSLKNTMEGAESVSEEMVTIRKTIENNKKFYKENKCDFDMEYQACVEKSRVLPPGTGFYRPLVSGRVTSVWGYRSFTLNGKPYSDFHPAVDYSASHGAKVYSSSEGVVAYVKNAKKRYDDGYGNQCGGNMVFINHKVNGVNYTTGYLHLKSIAVKEGQVVDANTVIGYVGGTSKEYWDNCSTGAHLHFQIAKGYWGDTYKSYSGFTSYSFDPYKKVNMPKLGQSFSNRKTKY